MGTRYTNATRIPSPGAMANRRFLVLCIAAAGLLFLVYAGMLRRPSTAGADVGGYGSTPIHHVSVADETLKGAAVMPKLGNETLKYVYAALVGGQACYQEGARG
jgi:hypothetical protein